MNHSTFVVALLAATLLLAGVQSALSQTAESASSSASGVNSSINAGAVAINNFPAAPTSTEIKTVGVATAPAVFGGGHPCLAGQSGSVGILGGALAYGRGDAEPICMLLLMKKSEAALILLATTNAGACRALVAAGDITANCPNSAKTRRSVSTSGTVAKPAAVLVGYTKCEVGADGKIRMRYKYGVDKLAANKSCLASLGY